MMVESFFFCDLIEEQERFYFAAFTTTVLFHFVVQNGF